MAHEGYEFDTNKPDCSDGDFYCRICDASMNSESMWASHIVGKKHIKKVTQGPRVIFKRKFDQIDDEIYDRPPKSERLDAGIKMSRWGSSDFPHKDQEDEYYSKKWGEGYMYDDGSNPRSDPEASYSGERYIEKGLPIHGPRNFDEVYPQRPWDERDVIPRNSYLFKPKESYDYGHKNTLSNPDPVVSSPFDISQSSSLPFKKEIINSLAFEEIINDIMALRKVNDIKITEQRVTDVSPLQIVENSRKTMKEVSGDQDTQQKVDEKISLKAVDDKVSLKTADEKVTLKRADDKNVSSKDGDRNLRRYDDRDIHQRGADKGSHEKDYDHRGSRRKDDDKSSHRKDDDRSSRRRDDKSVHRKDDDKNARRRDDDKSVHRKDDDKSSRQKSTDDRPSRYKDDDKGSYRKSTDDRISRYKDDDKDSRQKSSDNRPSRYKDNDRDFHIRDRDCRNLRVRDSDDRGEGPRSNNEKGSRQRDDDKASRQKSSEDKSSHQKDSSEKNSHVPGNDAKALRLRNRIKNICQRVQDKISSDEDTDDKVVKKKLSNGKILQLRINSTASCGKSDDVDKDDNEEYDKELLELLKEYSDDDDVLIFEDNKEKTKEVEKHVSSVSVDKSSNKKDLTWNEVDPERLSPSELDNLLSSYLKPKAGAEQKVKNDSPENIVSSLDTLPTKLFFKAVLKKVDNLIIKDWEELNMLSEIIVKAQSVLCSKLPPHLQAEIRQKMSGKKDEKDLSKKTPGSLNNPVISQSSTVSTHSVPIPLSHSTQNVPIISTIGGTAPNLTAIPTQLSVNQSSCSSGSTQPLPSVFQNKPLEQKSLANSALLQPPYQLPASVQNNPVLRSLFLKKCELLAEPKSSSSNNTQLPSQLTSVVWNNQLTMQNNQLPAVIQNNKPPVAIQNSRLPVAMQNNMISVLQNNSGVSMEQKLSLLNNSQSDVPSKFLAATQRNQMLPSVLQTLSNVSEQTNPPIHSPQLQQSNQQYNAMPNNPYLSMFRNKSNSLSEQKSPVNSLQSSSIQPPLTGQNNQPLLSVLQKIASSVREEKSSSLNSPHLQTANQLPSTAPNNQLLPSVFQKIISLSEQKSPSVNSSISESTNLLPTAKQKNMNGPSMNSPQSEPCNKLPINNQKIDLTSQASSTSAEMLKSNSASSAEAVSNVSSKTISHLTSKMIDALIAKKVLPSSALESSVLQKVSNFISEKLKQSLNNSDSSFASSSSDKNTLTNTQAPGKLDAEKLWEKYFIK